MRLYTVFSILVQCSLLQATAAAAESMELTVNNAIALNTSMLDTDTTNCTMKQTKHTEIMTCIFSQPRTHTVHCTRSQRSHTNSPPLRLRILGVENTTYVPENAESMLNIFIARELYYEHKTRSKKPPLTARYSRDYGLVQQEEVLTRAKKKIFATFIVMLTLLTMIVGTVAMFNAQHMFKMGSSDQKEVLDLALQRNDLIDKIRECARQKQWLHAELDKVRAEEISRGSDTLSMATIVS